MIFILIILTLLVIYSSYLLSDYVVLKKTDFPLKVLLTILFSIFHIYGIYMIAGLVIHNVVPFMVGLLSFTTSSAIIATFTQTQKDHNKHLKDVTKTWKSFTKGISKDRFAQILVALFILQQLLTVSRIVIAPPNVFDTQVYHLPISIEWHQSNDITLSDDVPVGRLNYATKLPKMLNFWVLSFGGGVEYIEFSQYFGYLLLLAVTYALLRDLKVSQRWSLAGMFAVSALPLVVIENHTLQDHMLLAALHMTWLKVAFDVLDKKYRSQWGIVILAVATALLLAAKFSTPAHFVVFAGVLGLLYFKDWIGLIRNIRPKTYMLSIALVGSLGLIWYVSNYVTYGSLFGPSAGQAQQDHIFLKNLMDLPYRYFDHLHRYTPDLIDLSGFGPLAAGFGFIASVWAVATFRRNKKILALFFTAVLTMLTYFIVYYTSYNYRLLIFVPVTLLIVGISYIAQSKEKLLQLLIMILLPLGMTFTMVTTVYTDYVKEPLQTYKDLLRLYPEDRTAVRFDYSSDKFKKDPSWLYIDQYIPESEPILFITQHEGPGYDDIVLAAYYGNTLERQTFWGGTLEETDFFTPTGRPLPQLFTYMRENDIRYVHNNSVFFYDPVPFDMEGTEFIRITDRLYYLPSK